MNISVESRHFGVIVTPLSSVSKKKCNHFWMLRAIHSHAVAILWHRKFCRKSASLIGYWTWMYKFIIWLQNNVITENYVTTTTTTPLFSPSTHSDKKTSNETNKQTKKQEAKGLHVVKYYTVQLISFCGQCSYVLVTCKSIYVYVHAFNWTWFSYSPFVCLCFKLNRSRDWCHSGG